MNPNLGKNVEIKVINVKGKCEYNHEPGQKFEHPFFGICSYAMHTLWPYIVTKRFDGKIPWEKNNKLKICCPNPNDLVVFELSIHED
ncbi:MAG: TIGR04076 family protein [Promethearchaeota archaeon]|jgi:uncharacterized repeat protein (TIGR04076 family)